MGGKVVESNFNEWVKKAEIWTVGGYRELFALTRVHHAAAFEFEALYIGPPLSELL